MTMFCDMAKETPQFQMVISFYRQLTSNQMIILDYLNGPRDHKCLPMWKMGVEEKVLSSDAVKRPQSSSARFETEEEGQGM